MPRSIAHRASSLRLQWLSGRLLSAPGRSQARAIIAQICCGVNVAGAPARGASARRCATATATAFAAPAVCVAGDAEAAVRQRCSQWRTVLGHTSSWRAISRTPVPLAASRIILARSDSFCGVPWARTKRFSTGSSATVIAIGSADRRGIGASTNRGKSDDSPCHARTHLTPPYSTDNRQHLSFSQTVAIRTHPSAMESPLSARGTSPRFGVTTCVVETRSSPWRP